MLRGERGSLSPLRSNKNTQTGGGGEGAGRGEGDTCARVEIDLFPSVCVCVRHGKNACAMIFTSFSLFFDRVRWRESTSRAIRHGLAGLSSCSIRSFSRTFFPPPPPTPSLLHCWQLYTSYHTTILGCSYFRCGQTPRSLTGAKPFYFRFKLRITEQFQKIYTNKWISRINPRRV